jgi:hypothetical protein
MYPKNSALRHPHPDVQPWVLRFNDGARDDKWKLPYRLAVALVLLNFEYLEDIGPGPGYTLEQAMLLLYTGMTHPSADLDAWMLAIRDATRHPDLHLRQPGRSSPDSGDPPSCRGPTHDLARRVPRTRRSIAAAALLAGRLMLVPAMRWAVTA